MQCLHTLLLANCSSCAKILRLYLRTSSTVYSMWYVQYEYILAGRYCFDELENCTTVYWWVCLTMFFVLSLVLVLLLVVAIDVVLRYGGQVVAGRRRRWRRPGRRDGLYTKVGGSSSRRYALRLAGAGWKSWVWRLVTRLGRRGRHCPTRLQTRSRLSWVLAGSRFNSRRPFTMQNVKKLRS